MDIGFIAKRVTQLRMKKDVTESQMSFDLGKSRNYVQKISSGKMLPSIKELLNICDYFQITPSDFFNVDLKEPALIEHLRNEASTLSERDIKFVLELVAKLKSK